MEQLLTTKMVALESALTNIGNEVSFYSTTNSVSLYYGDPQSLEDFVRSLSMVHQLTGNTHKSTIRCALMRAKGIAAETIKAYIESTDSNAMRWDDLKNLLEKQFGPVVDPRSALHTLRGTKQEPHMSVHHFSKILCLRSERAWPNADLTAPAIQSQIVEIFISGLKTDAVKRKLIITAGLTTLDAAVNLAFEEEKKQCRLASFGFGPRTTADPRNTASRQETPMEVDLLQSSSNTTLPLDYVSPMTATPADFAHPRQQVHSDMNEYYGYPTEFPPADDYFSAQDLNVSNPHAHADDPVSMQDPQGIAYPTEYDQSFETTNQPDGEAYALDAYGRRCYICDSPGHLFRDCSVRTQRFHAPRAHNPNVHPMQQSNYQSYQPRYTMQQPNYQSYQPRYRTPYAQNHAPGPTNPRYPSRFPPSSNFRQPMTPRFSTNQYPRPPARTDAQPPTTRPAHLPHPRNATKPPFR